MADTDPDLEELYSTLAWNWRKRPANPELRSEIASDVRACRADAFQAATPAERRQNLADVRQLHNRCKAKMQPLIEAKIVIRETYQKMLADFEVWQKSPNRHKGKRQAP